MWQGRSKVKQRLLAGAIGGGVLALGLAGLASGGLKERAKSFSVPAGEAREGVAKCKQSQNAIAGGFDLENDGDEATFAAELARAGKRRWRLGAVNNQSTESTAKVYVYCLKHAPKLKTVSETATTQGTSSEASEAVRARCPRGSEAVSGGFETGDLDARLPVASFRAGKRTWEAQFGGGGPVTVEVFAYCDKHGPGLKTKQKTIVGIEGQSESVRAKCKRKQRLVSGGFDVEFDEGQLDGAEPTLSRRDGKRRWEVGAQTFSETPTITAYAYCERKQKKS